MSGFVWCIGNCVACGVPIQYNPNRVPSITVNGSRQALCKSCFARWNQIHRTSKGLEPVPLDPQAYEPAPESDLP